MLHPHPVRDRVDLRQGDGQRLDDGAERQEDQGQGERPAGEQPREHGRAQGDRAEEGEEEVCCGHRSRVPPPPPTYAYARVGTRGYSRRGMPWPGGPGTVEA
ncbi:hypothetical protein LUX34_02970 [Streptomyces werraensis]|nr:hypothetical protein [Streptomyces werraensis]